MKNNNIITFPRPHRQILKHALNSENNQNAFHADEQNIVWLSGRPFDATMTRIYNLPNYRAIKTDKKIRNVILTCRCFPGRSESLDRS